MLLVGHHAICGIWGVGIAPGHFGIFSDGAPEWLILLTCALVHDVFACQ